MLPNEEKDNALLERGAANDIVRLRWRLKIRENIIRRLVAENERLRNDAACPHVRGTVTQYCSLNFTLTDAEREAIEWAALSFGNKAEELGKRHDLFVRFLRAELTLRVLLARLS
jgi:hypothetical protein